MLLNALTTHPVLSTEATSMQKNLSNKELVAAGHQFAKNLSSDTPLIDMAKMISQLATQLDVALVAAGEACKQRDAVLAENVVKSDVIERLIGQFSMTGYHAVQNSLNPAQSLLYDAMQAQKAPATDAYLNAVRAEGVDIAANFLIKADTVGSTGAMGHALHSLSLELRAETDTTSSQYESLAGDQ